MWVVVMFFIPLLVLIFSGADYLNSLAVHCKATIKTESILIEYSGACSGLTKEIERYKKVPMEED